MNPLAGALYGLCALTALACAVLLLSAYRRSGVRLLLWGGLCFAGLTLNNVILVIDVLVVPEIDLFTLRNVAALIGTAVLVWGLIWDVHGGLDETPLSGDGSSS